MGVSSSISTQQCPLKPRWPGWNPALQRANGSVEFHLDTAVPAETPLAGREPGPPTPEWEGRIPSPTSRRPLHPRWPGWNPALQRANGSVEFHLDTAVPAETPLAGMEPGPPTREWECRVPSRHSSAPWNPGWPGWNPALQGANGSVEFHLDTAVPPATPLAGMEPGPPRREWECRVPSRHCSAR